MTRPGDLPPATTAGVRTARVRGPQPARTVRGRAWTDALQAAVDDADLELGTFTDEEVLAATPDVPDHARLLPLPVVGALDEYERAIAARTARRSLIARGLLEQGTTEQGVTEPGEGDVAAAGALDVVTAAMVEADTVVVAERTIDGVRAERTWSLLAGVVALDHEPAADGTHRFSLRRADRAAAAIAAFLDPEGWATSDGPPLVHDLAGPAPAGWAQVDTATAAPRLSAKAFASGGRDPDRELLVAGAPGAVWLLSVPPGEDGRPVVRALTVAPSTLVGVGATLLGVDLSGPRAVKGRP